MEDDGQADECESSAFAQANGVVLKEKSRQESYTCECLDCGYTMKSKEHCVDVACPECGSEMRRKDKPGEGQQRMTIRELWERVKFIVELALTGQEVAQGLDQPEDAERAVSLGQVSEQLFDTLMERDEWAFPLDIYFDEGAIYALVAERGKLYRVSLSLSDSVLELGEFVEVETVHQPVGRTLVQRQADGRWRWFSVSATAVLNRVAEIDSRALFDSFVTQAEETGEYPVRDFYHGGETFRTGQADFLARDGNVLITSGVYDDTRLGNLEVRARLAEPDYWGDSIAYVPTDAPEMAEVAEGVRIPVYNEGKIRFISTLPEAEAASLFTAGEVQQEVGRMLQGKAMDAFVKLFDGDEEEARSWLDVNADGLNRAIDEAGMVTRDAETEAEPEADQEPQEQERDAEPEPEPEAEPEPQEREADPEPAEVVLDDAAITAIVDAVLASGTFQMMAERLEALGESVDGAAERSMQAGRELENQIAEVIERVADLERDDEEKQREWQADLPRRRQLRVTHRPREANDPKRQKEAADSLADAAEETLSAMPRY
jgi:predicted RNA-binding Zn-ribbon protein involved in translation (DUF1610 family)